MKKIVLAGLAVAAVAATSFAADVKISGSYELRGNMYDNANFSQDNNDQGTEARFFEQRFRVMTAIKASDAVSLTLRSDLSEGTWGTTDTQGTNGNGNFQLDRAFVTIKLPGQLGTTQIGTNGYDVERTGRLFNAHRDDALLYANNIGPVALTVGYVKLNETTTTRVLQQVTVLGDTLETNVTANTGIASNTDGEGDNDVYLVKASVKPMDNLTIAPYVLRASYKDGIVGNTEAYAFGADATFSAGMFGLGATLYFVDGEVDGGNDIEGTLFNIMGTVKPIPGLTIGAGYTFIDDTDANKDGLVSLRDGDQTNDPMRGFIFWGDNSHSGKTVLFGAGNEISKPSTGRFGAARGADVFKLSADYTFDKFGLGGHFIYAEEKTAAADTSKYEVTEFGAYASYKLYDNTTITGRLATAELEDNVAGVDRDNANLAALLLNVRF